jgi:hypothetical protein
MTDRNIVRMLGIMFLAVGILGFVPLFVRPATIGTPELVSTPGFGYLFGLFPVNLWHNLIHIGFGVWGITASQTLLGAQRYARNIAVIYGVLAVMGLIPGLNTTFGLVPIFGHDVWLHVLIAATAAYVGFGRRGETVTLEDALRRRAG